MKSLIMESVFILKKPDKKDFSTYAETDSELEKVEALGFFKLLLK